MKELLRNSLAAVTLGGIGAFGLGMYDIEFNIRPEINRLDNVTSSWQEPSRSELEETRRQIDSLEERLHRDSLISLTGTLTAGISAAAFIITSTIQKSKEAI